MKTILVLCFIFLGIRANAEDLLFKLKGEPLLTISIVKIRSGILKFKLNELHAKSITLYNVFRGYERTYMGYDFFQFLNYVYDNEWQQKQKLIFTSTDGYHQIVLIAQMLKAAKDKVGYIAYQEKGLNGFTPILKEGKKIDPGPLYLVWSNFSPKDKASHGDLIKWPYQLCEINIE